LIKIEVKNKFPEAGGIGKGNNEGVKIIPNITLKIQFD
jgi:hypothetical protein